MNVRAPILSKEESVLFERSPFSGDIAWRRRHFDAIVTKLTQYHFERCDGYRNILKAIHFEPSTQQNLEELPYLPVGLFKRLDLMSVPATDLIRILNSSGTSRTARSRIFLDQETSLRQMAALEKIVKTFIGDRRLPVLVLDAPRAPVEPTDYAARTVALKGFSMLGNGKVAFALTEEMQPNFEEIEQFKDAAAGKFLVFGFTYIIWRYILQILAARKIRLDLGNGVMIHGGGWKRLENEGVTDGLFRQTARDHLGLSCVHNYYAMVEQTGSIFMQCEHGFMHCSNFSDVFIRSPQDLTIQSWGKPGLIQAISILPKSYPGHNLLTEDLGMLQGQDDCLCGRHGKYFKIFGRLPNSQPKGCGDVAL